MPTPAIIPVTPGAGINLDAVSLVVGLNTVVRETMVIADPTSPTELATVSGGSLNVSLPSGTVTTLTPPSAAAIAAAIVANPPTVAATISGPIGVSQSTSPWVVSLASTTITGSVAVTGTFWQATQPVSGTVASTQSGTWNIGAVQH